jgi:hypothetical protein
LRAFAKFLMIFTEVHYHSEVRFNRSNIQNQPTT